MKYIVGDVDAMQDFEIETDDIDVEASVVLIKEEERITICYSTGSISTS
jgi:hypothetical protein